MRVEPGYRVDVTPSTTWEWKLCKVKPAPAGEGAAKPLDAASRVRSRDLALPLTCTFRYRGGPESSWLGHRGGFFWRFPGWMCLDDVCQILVRKTYRA